MALSTHFSDFPLAPFSPQFAFEDNSYQLKVKGLDERIQQRVKNYETMFEEKKAELVNEQTKNFEQKQKLYQTIGAVVGQAIGFAAGVLLSWNNSETRPFTAYTCSLFSLYAGHVVGSETGKRMTTLPPLNTHNWKRAICVEEVSGLTKDWYEMTGLIAALEARDADHPDIQRLTELNKLLIGRIGKIRDIVKEIFAKNSADLSPEDDIDLSTQETKGINSCSGVVSVPKSLFFLKFEDNELSVLKRTALTMTVSTLFEKCVPLLFVEPLLAAGGDGHRMHYPVF